MTQVHLSTRQRQTHRQTCGCQRGERGEGGVGWESGVRCKVLHTEWTNNKVLLYCIGDYVQYPGIL